MGDVLFAPEPPRSGSSREAQADDVAEEPDLSFLNPSTQSMDISDVDEEEGPARSFSPEPTWWERHTCPACAGQHRRHTCEKRKLTSTTTALKQHAAAEAEMAKAWYEHRAAAAAGWAPPQVPSWRVHASFVDCMRAPMWEPGGPLDTATPLPLDGAPPPPSCFWNDPPPHAGGSHFWTSVPSGVSAGVIDDWHELRQGEAEGALRGAAGGAGCSAGGVGDASSGAAASVWDHIAPSVLQAVEALAGPPPLPVAAHPYAQPAAVPADAAPVATATPAIVVPLPQRVCRSRPHGPFTEKLQKHQERLQKKRRLRHGAGSGSLHEQLVEGPAGWHEVAARQHGAVYDALDMLSLKKDGHRTLHNMRGDREIRAEGAVAESAEVPPGREVAAARRGSTATVLVVIPPAQHAGLTPPPMMTQECEVEVALPPCNPRPTRMPESVGSQPSAGGVLCLCPLPDGVRAGHTLLLPSCSAAPPPPIVLTDRCLREAAAAAAASRPACRGPAELSSDSDDASCAEVARRRGHVVVLALPDDVEAGERLIAQTPDGSYVAFDVPWPLPPSRKVALRRPGVRRQSMPHQS